MPVSPNGLEVLVRRYRGRRRALIQVLQDIHDRYRWLPPEALERVAEALGVPLVQVYGVATFYKSFSLTPRGRHVCTVCLGTACHVRGGAAVLEEFERRLGIAAGRTTSDGRHTLERVNCLGACALAPLVVVDGHYHGQMTPVKVGAVLAAAAKDEAA
ncbi:MAG TPA: NADH-quinone oxidoreductase subunit NuoE [Candidatus Aminicenantes bacterium]|nr:NADH-quinone oxidoreductase subunit NuoE [Candidatus Aminicenantes bacterium]